jgi:hypothetical protein
MKVREVGKVALNQSDEMYASAQADSPSSSSIAPSSLWSAGRPSFKQQRAGEPLPVANQAHTAFRGLYGNPPPTGSRRMKRPDEFNLRNLARPYETPKRVVLPPEDLYGWPMGEDYSGLLEARTPSLATRAVIRGLKLQRCLEALSQSELAVFVTLMFNPYVLDLRDQYPVYKSENYWKAESNSDLMLRSDVMTIDLIVAHVMPGCNQLRFHGISVKHASYKSSKKDLKREQRERDAMVPRGWTWELICSDEIPRIEVDNCMLLYTFIRDSDVPGLCEKARTLAACLAKSTAKGPMFSVIGRISRLLGICLDDGYRLFAVAVAYGFLTLDHSIRLDRDRPLSLIW